MVPKAAVLVPKGHPGAKKDCQSSSKIGRVVMQRKSGIGCVFHTLRFRSDGIGNRFRIGKVLLQRKAGVDCVLYTLCRRYDGLREAFHIGNRPARIVLCV